MLTAKQLIRYQTNGLENLLERGHFSESFDLGETQEDAFRARLNHLKRTDLSTRELLQWFSEIAQGIGKSAMQVTEIHMAQEEARKEGKKLKAILVVPTIIIMNQTYGEIKKFVPDLLKYTGRYGGDFRDLDQDLTIIVSDSFLDLVESGQVSDKTHQMIVIDEGHKEISERRVHNINKRFDRSKILTNTYTATKEYDEVKSVMQTHGEHGFTRRFPECVRRGELSEFVIAELHLIGVMPPTKHQEQKAAANGEKRLKYKMRMEAWTEFVVEHFRSNINDQTGLPVSDNHAGFYGADTYHADRVEEALNADPVLQEKANAMGLKGVAIALHTNMSRALLRDRIQTMYEGAYLAYVMDDMGKEGLNVPHMRTVYDWLHYSTLQKRQIVGRPSRKFNNPRRDFLPEGTLVVDALPYIGSFDPIKNERLKKSVLTHAVTASEIIEGDYVLGPGVKRSSHNRPKDRRDVILSDRTNIVVESYVTSDEVRRIFAQRESLIEAIWKENPLTLAQIRNTIDGYREHNNNGNPDKSLGMIEHGDLAGRLSYAALDIAMTNGGNGLRDDYEYLEWARSLGQNPRPTIKKYLIHLGYDSALTMTLDDIIEMIDAYRKSNKNKNPDQKSGTVKEGVAAGLIEWTSINRALERGSNGLHDDSKWIEWSKAERKAGKTPTLDRLLIHLGYKKEDIVLTMKNIKASVDYHRCNNKKQNPKADKTLVEGGDLHERLSYSALNKAISKGNHGLKDDLAWKRLNKKKQAMGEKPYLQDCLALWGYAMGTLEMKLIVDAMDRHIANDADKKEPARESGDVKHGKMKNKISWYAIDAALKIGSNGLNRDPIWKQFNEAAKAEGAPFSLAVFKKKRTEIKEAIIALNAA